MTAKTQDTAETTAHDPAASAPASPMSRYARRYTAELAERILNEVQSGRALQSVCRDDGIPAYPTVYGWVLRDVEGFAGRYARACDGNGRRGARAIQYSPELADRIVREIERGRSLHDVCRGHGLPAYRTVLGWTVRIRDFGARYHRARAIGNPRHGGEILYTAEIADRILAGLASGRTLYDICFDDDLPSDRTVYHWVSDDREGFTARYYQAREAGRRKMGRPTLYTPELADRILYELSDGRTLRDICRADGMPSTATIRLWALEDRDGFAARYRTARENALHDMSDEILEIIDDGRNDWMERRARDGGFETVPNPESVPRSRLRLDGRTWLLKNRMPKFYGNRTAADTKEEAVDPWAEILRLVDGTSRGLPNQRRPIDPAKREEFERKFRNHAGPSRDRL